jgi:L-aspartate oxidase
MPASDFPRYLVSFHPKRVSHRFADVLVIGSGLAGMRAALAVDRDQEVFVLSKSTVQQSNSQWAQGGIAAVWDSADNFGSHIEDTIIAGQGLCDRRIVEFVVREAPHAVGQLIEWGAHFDVTGDGEVALTREGGHSFSRILHALGDATGREIMRTVFERARGYSNIHIVEDVFTTDLITESGRCIGAVTYSESTGLQLIWASQTIIATGGCGALYRETTNPPTATGDGIAMAYRAGATLEDMEFMQFHPTVLYAAGSARHLISEAVRGEGALLVDARGERFMPAYDSRAELAPRDIVAQAIVRQMEKTKHPCVYLDQRHLEPAKVRSRFPGITAACDLCGLDFARDLIPVRPGAHYMVGGIRTDADGRTSVPGLWASGEAAATGLHGANRLASNSLLEALVFGESCGRLASAAAREATETLRLPTIEHRRPMKLKAALDVADIRNSLQSLMVRRVGIEREGAGLEEAKRQVDFWSQYVLDNEFADPAGWELQNMLSVAGAMIRWAIERTESRGTHYRSDYPTSDDARWRVHLTRRRDETDYQRVPVDA